jgi:hypothetical protein
VAGVLENDPQIGLECVGHQISFPGAVVAPGEQAIPGATLACVSSSASASAMISAIAPARAGASVAVQAVLDPERVDQRLQLVLVGAASRSDSPGCW